MLHGVSVQAWSCGRCRLTLAIVVDQLERRLHRRWTIRHVWHTRLVEFRDANNHE